MHGTSAALPWERGTVHGRASLATLPRTLWAARTVTTVALRLECVDLADESAGALAQVRSLVTAANWTRMPSAPFAVRAERRGQHPFRSPELASVVGATVIDAVRRRTGRRLPVNLDEPVTEVRVELDGRRLRVGYDLAGTSLHRRWWQAAHHHAGLRPSAAAALLAYAGWADGEALLDPMTGGGTVPIEAGLIALRRPPRHGALPRLQALGLDDAELSRQTAADLVAAHRTPGPLPIRGLELYPSHVATARANQASAGLTGALRIDRGDATVMAGIDQLDRLVANPPYGLRAGSPRMLAPLYDGLLARTAERLTPDGRAVVLTPAARVLREAADKAGLAIEDERAITLGKLDVRAFRLTHPGSLVQ